MSTLKQDTSPDTRPISSVVEHKGRRGFLPFPTNTFDRVFISVVLFVAIHLLWMRFLEAYVTIWGATVLSLVVAYYVIRKG
jgi:predicted small integral membrane protein